MSTKNKLWSCFLFHPVLQLPELYFRGRQEKWCPLQLQGGITTHFTLLWTSPYIFSLDLALELQTLISSCIYDISIWLFITHLKLIRSKTEVWFSTWDSLISANGNISTQLYKPQTSWVTLHSFPFLIHSCNTSARLADSYHQNKSRINLLLSFWKPPPSSKTPVSVMPPTSFLASIIMSSTTNFPQHHL